MDYAEKIKSMVSMPEMMEHYGFSLNRSGFCKCPFHSERSASFKAYPGQRGYYCFGCGAHGSVIDFVMLYFGFSFKSVPRMAISLSVIWFLGGFSVSISI